MCLNFCLHALLARPFFLSFLQFLRFPPFFHFLSANPLRFFLPHNCSFLAPGVEIETCPFFPSKTKFLNLFKLLDPSVQPHLIT